MVRHFWLLILVAAGVSVAQERKQPPAEPPEEDEALATKEYAFNPLQAAKEIRIGEFYARKGSHRAAALRFEEATRWEPTNTRAWMRLAEMREKLKEDKAAREAWAKYLELEPNAKNAAAIKRKLADEP